MKPGRTIRLLHVALALSAFSFAEFGLSSTYHGDVSGAPAQDDPAFQRVVQLVQSSPTQLDRLRAALDWAEERRAVRPLLDRLEQDARTSAAWFSAGQIAEWAGLPSRAFGNHERALAIDPSSAQNRGRLIALAWRAGARARARKLAREPWELDPKQDEERIRFLIAPTDEALKPLLAVAKRDPERAIAWARERGEATMHAELALQLERPNEAARAWLAAGQPQRAWDIVRQATPDKWELEVAYRISRALGDRTIWEQAKTHLPSKIASADEYEKRLEQSLGSRPADVRDPGEAIPRDTEPGDTEPGDSEDHPSVSFPPTASPGDSPAVPSEALPLGADPSPKDRALLRAKLNKARYSPPGLERVWNWLRLDEFDEAEREWVRWQLDPNEEDRARWLPLLARDPSATFVETHLPFRILAECRDAAGLTSGLEPRLSRALDESEPGTSREARLLFHRGRLFNRPDDRLRAARIAPNLRVSWSPGNSAELTTIDVPLKDAVRPLAARFGSPTLPDPLGVAVGQDTAPDGSRRTARLGVTPVGAELSAPTEPGAPAEPIDSCELWSWSPTSRDVARSTVELVGTDRVRLSTSGEDSQSVSVRLSSIAPLRGAVLISAPGMPWSDGAQTSPRSVEPMIIAWGQGIAVLAGLPRPESIWQLRTATAIDPGQLPASIAPLLPPAWGEFLRAVVTLPTPSGREVDFLAEARARREDPTVAIRSRHWIGGRWVVHTTDGLRAEFGPRPPGNTDLQFPAPFSREDYRSVGVLWVRSDLANTAPAAPDSSRPSSEYVLIQSPFVGRPNANDPELPPAESTVSRSVVHFAQWGDYSVEIDASGWTLGRVAGESRPRWWLHVPPPLPGPAGFLSTAARSKDARVRVRRDRVLPGGASRRGVPRVTWDGGDLFVHTDRVWRIANPWSIAPSAVVTDLVSLSTENSRSTERGDSSERDAEDPLPGIRDIVAISDNDSENTGRVIWLDGEMLRIDDRRHRVEGAFDLCALDDRVFVLVRRRQLQLFEVDVASGTLSPCPLPTGIELENDRAGLRLAALGVGPRTEPSESRPATSQIYFLFDALYVSTLAKAGGTISLPWQTAIRWSDHDPFRATFYWQRPPVLGSGLLYVDRPWGTREVWETPN